MSSKDFKINYIALHENLHLWENMHIHIENCPHCSLPHILKILRPEKTFS